MEKKTEIGRQKYILKKRRLWERNLEILQGNTLKVTKKTKPNPSKKGD